MPAMVVFETIPGTAFSTLRMVCPEEDKVTSLVAYTSLYKGHATNWPPLSSSESEKGRNWSFVQEKVIYLEGSDADSSDPPPGFWFLGGMISAGYMKWNGPLKICGNFEYIPGYWEWVEDVLSRCSSILDKASLSNALKASLCVYDCSDAFLKTFFVPSAECFSPSLDSDNRIPRSHRFLLLGYHRLASHSLDGTMSISSWIGFWNYSLRTYVGHEAADQSSTKTAPGSVCPRGPTIPHCCAWDSRDRYPFDILEVDADLEEEFYCVAFLSCWLCVFVFPAEPLGFIRASVFMMASIMAKGWRVSLVPPVLACIYRANNRPDGPSMMRYHGRGRGTVLHSCLVSWKATRPSRSEPYFFDDKESLSNNSREMGDLSTGFRFWHLCILSRAKQSTTFPSDSTLNSQPAGYRSWLSRLFSSDVPLCLPKNHGKGKGPSLGMHPSSSILKSSNSSKRKHSLEDSTEDRDPKHARGARKEASSSRGSKAITLAYPMPKKILIPTPRVVEVSSSASGLGRTELVDIGKSPEGFVTEVAESSPPLPHVLSLAQEAAGILRAGAVSLWSLI
ncbi:hypothetical protein LIER_27271 [Lithospermum erythrorhizon]|uniref:Aminotransferase-like plant mobile domain-containing protein n=1 Tax=Lithospermum erythrorhizon TaxID=34254 RepID=A0AAV3RD26_LITER